MDKRSLKILEAVVDEYIRTGEPVGSKAVLEKLKLNISSATVRNVMASLERQGYLEHPHTSAGRVPTFSGYRLYIESFMPEHALSAAEKEQIDRIFEHIDADTDEEFIQEAGKALAAVTKCAVVTASETGKFSVITKVEVVPTGRRMYVLLLITSRGNIKNRVCRLQFDLTHEQVQFFTRFVNENLTGLNIDDISEELTENLCAAMGSYMMLLSPLMKGIAEMSAEMTKEQVDVQGGGNLLTCGQLRGDEIAALLDNSEKLSGIFDNAFSGINVMFGEEKNEEGINTFVVSNSGIITGTFERGGEKAGSFGLIGPVRMDYKKIIPYMEYFSDKVTNMLNERREDDELIAIEKEANKIDEED